MASEGDHRAGCLFLKLQTCHLNESPVWGQLSLCLGDIGAWVLGSVSLLSGLAGVVLLDGPVQPASGEFHWALAFAWESQVPSCWRWGRAGA